MADWEEVLEGTELAMNASGSATERMAIWSESLQGKLNSLKDSWDKFIMGLGSSEVFEDIIDILTGLLDILDLLINKIPILSNLIKVTLVAQAVNVLLGSLKQLKTLFGKSGLSFGGLISTQTIKDVVSGFTDANAVIKETIKTTEGGAQVTTHYAVALGKAAKAAVNFAIAHPAVAVAALTAAVVAGIAAFAIYNNSLTGTKKKYEELKEAAAQEQEELESLQSELDQINQQISNIESQGTLSLSDQEDLRTLRLERKELELMVAAQEKAAQLANRDAVESAERAFNKEYKGIELSTDREEYTGNTAQGNYLHNVSSNITEDSSNLAGAIKSWDLLNSKKEQSIKAGEQLRDVEEQWLENAETAMSNHLTQLEDYKNTLELAGMENTQFYQEIESYIGAIQSRLAPGEWRSVKLAELFDTNAGLQDLETQFNDLQTQLSDGLIDEETYKQKLSQIIYAAAQDPEVLEAFQSVFNNLDNIDTESVAQELAGQLGVALDSAMSTVQFDSSNFDNLKSQIESEFGDLSQTMYGASIDLQNAVNDALETGDVSGIGTALDDIGTSVQNYQDKIAGLESTFDNLATNAQNAVTVIDTVSANMDALTGATSLTGAETEELYNTLASMPSVIDPMTGAIYDGMTLANIAIGNTSMSAAEQQEYIKGFLGSVQDAGNNTITVMDYVRQAINNVKQALATALNSAAAFVDNASKMVNKIGNSFGGKLFSKVFGIDASDITAATDGLAGAADQLRNWSTQLSESISTGNSEMIDTTNKWTGALRNAGNTAKDAYDAAIKGGSGAGSAAREAKDATEELTEALKEQYEAAKEALEAQKEALQKQKEALQEEKDGLEDAKDSINDLIDMTMKMLKQQYQDQLDALEDQLDAIEDQVDAYEDKIDKQKELLDLQREEAEHQDELAEKNRAIADIQAELAEIQFDNSAEAQKRRLELLDELNSAQQDLSDYQQDHDYDTKQDALDQELENFKNSMDARKEIIEQQQEQIQNMMNDDYNLYMQAIALIEGRTDQFYNDLVEWNKIYGTHVTQDVINTWNEAYTALDTYGYLGVGVQGILEGISARCTEIDRQNKIIEQDIKNIENQLDILKAQYDAAVAAVKDQTAATDAAAESTKGLASAASDAAGAYNNMASAAWDAAAAANAAAEAAGKAIKAQNELRKNQASSARASSYLGGANGAPKYHTGTDYVKPASSWLNKMLGLDQNETAAILKRGEAVIPDYANPFNQTGEIKSAIRTQGAPAGITNASSVNDNSVTIKIGDIIIQGDADENTVAKLNKTKESIIQEMFKRINKHSMMNGYKNVRYSN